VGRTAARRSVPDVRTPLSTAIDMDGAHNTRCLPTQLPDRLLEDIYTAAERTLIDTGHWETVKKTRQEFQMAMREPFTAAVEDATGRKVIAFMSQVHLDPDVAAEIFILKPTASEVGADIKP
jgi:Na+-translocating membrane potential-generating system MpsC-like protein